VTLPLEIRVLIDITSFEAISKLKILQISAIEGVRDKLESTRIKSS